MRLLTPWISLTGRSDCRYQTSCAKSRADGLRRHHSSTRRAPRWNPTGRGICNDSSFTKQNPLTSGAASTSTEVLLSHRALNLRSFTVCDVESSTQSCVVVLPKHNCVCFEIDKQFWVCTLRDQYIARSALSLTFCFHFLLLLVALEK